MENEGVENENEGLENAILPPEQKDIAYGVLPPSTTMMEDTIGAPWDTAT